MILTEFDLRVLLPEDRAVKIKHLWKEFHSLYIAFKDGSATGELQLRRLQPRLQPVAEL